MHQCAQNAKSKFIDIGREIRVMQLRTAHEFIQTSFDSIRFVSAFGIRTHGFVINLILAVCSTQIACKSKTVVISSLPKQPRRLQIYNRII